MATEPPFTFTFSNGIPSSRVTAMACTAKASFSSNRSTLSAVHPAFASTFCTPVTGAIITHCGSTPLVACARIRTSGSSPRAFALAADIITSAAPASFTPGAFPAVTVPSFLNAGFRARNVSTLVSSRIDSSRSNSVGACPFFLAGISTGTTCDLKRHSLHASAAFWCDCTAYASCSSRVMLYFSATFSAVCPMW